VSPLLVIYIIYDYKYKTQLNKIEVGSRMAGPKCSYTNKINFVGIITSTIDIHIYVLGCSILRLVPGLPDHC
jgi:hypothetical protein